MEKTKRIILVSVGVALLISAAFLLIFMTRKTNNEQYLNSLEEQEITTITLSKGDIVVIKTDKLEDTISIVKILDKNGDLVTSSTSELGESISIIYTAEKSGEYKIVATLDNPDDEVDGVITISIQQYNMLYLLLLGALFIFAAILVISSSLLREQYIIPSDVIKTKKKIGGLMPEKEPAQEPAGLSDAEIKKKYKSLIQPVGDDVIKSFIGRIYNGIAKRDDIIGGYAIDLKKDTLIWGLAEQKGKKEIELTKPIPLSSNRGLYSIFEKIINLYGGILPAEIVLRFPNYFINGLVHKQVLVLILLKPEVDWGISSTIFKKEA